jgi:chaperonin cofactor prefoldin
MTCKLAEENYERAKNQVSDRDSKISELKSTVEELKLKVKTLESGTNERDETFLVCRRQLKEYQEDNENPAPSAPAPQAKLSLLSASTTPILEVGKPEPINMVELDAVLQENRSTMNRSELMLQSILDKLQVRIT